MQFLYQYQLIPLTPILQFVKSLCAHLCAQKYMCSCVCVYIHRAYWNTLESLTKFVLSEKVRRNNGMDRQSVLEEQKPKNNEIMN